jgi:uncharacterized protein (TIGR03086 family)
MNEQKTFIRADEVLHGVVEKIEDEQWDMQLPADFPRLDDRSYSLREIMTYQAYDEAWIPDMMAGRTMDEVGADTFGGPFDNDLLGDDPKAGFGELVRRAVQAVRQLDGSELDERTVHYSYGDYPAREALWHAIVFRTTRAHDIANAIGVDSDLPDDLVAAVWDIVEPHAEEWREIGVFGPRVDVADDAPLQDRLLGLTGRTPT